MRRTVSHLDEVHFIAKLADLKETHYQTTLTLQAVVDLLIEKKLITGPELEAKRQQLDALLDSLAIRPTYPIS